jgi:broad specificity phosphatase PhoE
MEIYFIRHSEPDYSFINKTMNCQWSNLAPLTKNGQKLAKELRNNMELQNGIIISSPYTRAFQTASIFANGKDIIIEPLIHEWLPSKSFSIKAIDVPKINKEYKKYEQQLENGIMTKDIKDFETKEEMTIRMNKFIEKYKEYDKIIVFSHSRFMSNFLNIKEFDYCEVVKFVKK